MTATDKLRAMLDERGVEWWPSDDPLCEDVITHWRVGPLKWTAIEGEKDLWLNAGIAGHEPLTPEQAIAATLVAGTCHNADIGTEGYFKCSECGTSCSVDWECNGWDVPRFCPNCGRKVVDE